MSFAHLHVHTEYSLLDGMSRIKNLVQRCVELEMDSLAITDHGAMYGVIEFYRVCKEAGVKPIIGLEAYLAPRGMTDRDPRLDSQNYHLLLLAADQAGYKNLLTIASIAQLEGFYYKPRIDKEFLADHAEGLISTSGCIAAEIPQLILGGKEDEASRQLNWYQEVFGPERFYIELQDHNIPDLRRLNDALVNHAKRTRIPLLATNDVHYVRKEDAVPHDVLLCIGTGNLVTETNRLKFSDDSYYLRSPQEMQAIFADVPEALSSSLKIAEMCNVQLDDKEYKLPDFPLPEGYDAHSYLRFLCERGLRQRYGEQAESSRVRQRLEHELNIIHAMGFDTYFLIVWDLCEFARRQDIWWNVRGSGAGSVVAYSLGITNIDPLKNSLIFERFLNPGRVSMPDIDLDYPDSRRAEMIDYCVQQYGEDKVAQIITFGTLGARAAVRDVGRTLDIPLNEVDHLARLIPAIPGKPVSIQQALEEVPELRNAYEDASRPYIKQLLDTAAQLEGISRHASTHAAGVIVADKPLTEYIPLGRPTKSSESTNRENLGIISQWPMEIVESIGLLKIDFLGLRTLTIMRKACELIEHYHNVHYDLGNIPYCHLPDEPEDNARLDKAFALLATGNTSGVFQVEGTGMTNTLIEMRPSRFEHIVAAISLFRPGPIEHIPTYIQRMHGKEEISYHHPLLEPVLGETYGIIVYQEQIMQIASDLFGYNMADADLMRRAVAKKKEKDLQKHRNIFQKRGPAQGVSAEVAGQIFDEIDYFARYGFNKSHAADYAVLTVQTAYLKAHYPHEYMAALLTVERDNTDKVGNYVVDCRNMAIRVLPPDINASGHDFTIENQPDGSRAIRYGLSAIKNVGEGAVECMLQARQQEPFSSVADLCERIDLRAVGKRALESLVKVGALDSLAPRLQLVESLERLLGFSSKVHQASDIGQMSLFGETTGVTLDMDSGGLLVDEVTLDIPQRELLRWERDLVGLYVSEHPLQEAMDKISQVVTAYSNQLTEADHDRQVTMAGVVTYVRRHVTKSGKPMAFAGIEDLYGQIEVVVWPSTWDETQELWESDRVLLLRGKIDATRGEPKLLCDEASTNLSLFECTPESMPSTSNNHGCFPEAANTPPVEFHESLYVQYPPDELVLQLDSDDKALDLEGIGDITNDAPLPLSPAGTPGQHFPLDIEEPFPLSEPNRDSSGIRKLLIYVHRSGDQVRDQRKLQHVYGLLHSHPGNDTFTIFLADGAMQIEVDFPNETTDCNAVEGKLKAVLGPDSVQIA